MKCSKYNYFYDSKFIVVNLISLNVIRLKPNLYHALKTNSFDSFSKQEFDALLKMRFINDISDEFAYYSHRGTEASKFGLTILTTTGCNARCPYCYEKGLKTVQMSEKTQNDVCNFIKTSGYKDISIVWFGGEPLLNVQPIDSILSFCNLNGIHVESTMISNGYLVGKYLDKIVNDWQIKKIQIKLLD